MTREFISDNSFQNLTDVTRYVPGVAIHQGEGNRDELIIRGVDSSANFFVNGFRDDVQYFRDLYNAQSIEILKGPSPLPLVAAPAAVLSTAHSKKLTARESMRRPHRLDPTSTAASPSTQARPSIRTSPRAST